jgi:pyruvate dehydrogenase E2 component (dihydrolipoamide acetyltransferase)
MAEVILMPRLSDTMTEGVIAAWHKKVGDTVKKGDLLAEVETDKATMELESYKDGVLLHIGADKGAKLQVNDLLAIIGKAGEDISSLLKSATPAAAPTATATATSTDSKAPQETAAPTPATTPSAHATLDLSKIEEVVLMPRLSDTMEAGVIASWNKQVGDTVKKGEVLAEIETDKATMELESYKNGTLLYIGAQQGEKIPVNGLLCIIGEKGKVDVDAIVAASTSQPLTAAPVATPAATSSTATAVATAVAAPAMATVVSEALPASNGRIIASPLAKKIAQEKGVDLRQLKGSGDGGRIIKSDIDRFQPGSAAPAAATAPAALPVFTGQTTEGYTDIPNSQMRGVIAKRLAESKFTAPHFYLKMEVNMDNAISARTQLNEFSPVKVSFNDMIVKAVSLALREHPAVNASWMGDKIRRYQHVHIGVAVAIEDGLIVPVIRFADQKTLPQIAAETKELASKAKNKKLQPNEFTGNTFTISNLGMMDIDEFTAIINPPDSCIMAVGRISEKIIRKGDSFAATQVMKLTLSCDHRSVDGATGAAFLQTVKRFLENPVRLFL